MAQDLLSCFSADDHRVLLSVVVIPGSEKNEVCGVHNGRCKIRVKAPPVDGAANKMLMVFLAKALRIAKGNVSLVKGHTGKNKVLAISQKTSTEICSIMEKMIKESGK